jgi:Sulfotransferase family
LDDVFVSKTWSKLMTVSRREAWIPPVRPEWVSRINEEGAGLDVVGIVPLDAGSLITAACSNTGLDDFGADDWREPFEVMLKSFNEEAALTLIGRIMTRSDLLMFLEGRLRVEDAYKRHPEIEDEVIEAPLWVLGQGRTGTTMLQTLLSLDPENRTLIIRDALFPVHKEGDPNAYFATADHRIRMWNRVTPEVASIHDFAAHEPIEMIMIESLSFQQPAWLNLLGLAPSFTGYVAQTGGISRAVAYGKRVLKLLQWQAHCEGEPKKRWALKSPDHLRYITDLLAAYPDVRLIWAHRDPVKAMASAVNMIGTLTWIRSDQKVSEGMFDAITDPVAASTSLSAPIDLIEAGILPAKQLHNLQYEDLISDPAATIAAAYAHFGLTLGVPAREAIVAHLAAHPRSSRPPHRYEDGDASRIDEERAMFTRYENYFRVPREI